MVKLVLQQVSGMIQINMVIMNADYTCNPDYMHVWNCMMSRQTEFMSNVEKNSDDVYIQGLGKVNLSHIRDFKHIAQQAYDLKVRMSAYWKIVPRRIIDAIALHLLFSIRNLVNELLVGEIVKEAMGPSGDGITRLFDESPSIASKREKLNNSIRLLKESKNVLSKIMDQITAYE